MTCAFVEKSKKFLVIFDRQENLKKVILLDTCNLRYWTQIRREIGGIMAEKILDRIMLGAKTPEGKIIAIVMTIALALMVWDSRSMSYAF